MIDLYAMNSPNVVKIAIMLEEIGRPYQMHHVGVVRGDARTPGFLALNPLGKVPVIIDREGASAGQPIFESGAILQYLAETYAPHLLPAEGPARWEVLKWLTVQVAFAGPMLGQLTHFQLIGAQSDTYAAGRYKDQAGQVYEVYERRLSSAAWLSGDNFSIADIAMYPWAAYLVRHGYAWEKHPHFLAWRTKLDDRPSIKRAYKAIYALVEAAGDVSATPAQVDKFFGRSKPGPGIDWANFVKLGPLATVRLDER